MNRWIANALGVSLIAAACLTGWAAWRWGLSAPGPTSALVQGAAQALATVNRPCAPGPCGTLAVADKTITKVGDAIVTTQLEERAIAPHTVAAVDALKGSADALTATSQAATGSFHALDGSAYALTGTLNTATTTLDAAKAPINAFTQDAVDLDALLKDRAIHATLTNVEGMTDSGNKMLADAQWKEHQLLHPDKVKLGFWGSVWLGAKYVHQFEPPLF